MQQLMNSENSLLKIYTLGGFKVIKAGEVISDTGSSYYKVWKLFKYLITHKRLNQNIEVIMENLWPEQKINNPKHTFQNLIYRLRKILSNDTEEFIKSSGGNYTFNFASENYFLDTEYLVSLTQKANSKTDTDQQKALIEYEKALELYRGQYLPDLLYEDWVSLVRDYYHQVYIKSVLDTVHLLEKKKQYEKIVSVCEKALQHELYEENLHYSYLKALLELGKKIKARKHFKEVISLFEQELGIRPSTRLYSLLQRPEENAFPRNEGFEYLYNDISLEDYLFQVEQEGVFFCDPKTFSQIYRLEKIKEKRGNPKNIFWSICFSPSKDGDKNILEEEMKVLKKILLESLRQNDIVTRWSVDKYFIILSGIIFRDINKVIQRVEKKYLLNSEKKLKLNNQYRSL
ncbi:MAG: AfsR/SARP family transcriptional regulator [Halanaerobiaceae bacterium]